MKPYAYDRRDDHGSIQLHQGGEVPRTYPDEKLIPLYSAEQVAELQEQVRLLTEQRDAVVVEMAALKSGDAFFSYGSEHGFEWHKTAKQAAENAEAAIDDYRGDACDGWSEEVTSICWGVIMQSSTMVGERPRTEDDRCDSAIDTICDYALLPAIETPATDAAIAAMRAEGIEQWIASRNGAWNGTTKQAEEFARQLRESKGEVQS